MNKKNNLSRKLASILLSLTVFMTMMPIGVFADDAAPADAAGQAGAETVLPEGDAGEGAAEATDATGTDVAGQESGETADAEGADGQQTDTAGADSTEGDAPHAELIATDTQTGETPADTEEPEEELSTKTAKSFKMGGYSLKFKSNVLVDQPLNKKFGPVRTWITGNKKSIKVSWSKEAKSAPIDGYIILRKAGKEKVYT